MKFQFSANPGFLDQDRPSFGNEVPTASNSLHEAYRRHGENLALHKGTFFRHLFRAGPQLSPRKSVFVCAR